MGANLAWFDSYSITLFHTIYVQYIILMDNEYQLGRKTGLTCKIREFPPVQNVHESHIVIVKFQLMQVPHCAGIFSFQWILQSHLKLLNVSRDFTTNLLVLKTKSV